MTAAPQITTGETRKWSRVGRRSLLVTAILLGSQVLTAPSAPAAAARDRPQVVLVTGFACPPVDHVCQPFKKALRRTGVVGRAVAPDPREDYTTTISLLARQEPDLMMFFPDFPLDVALRVAPRFPRTRFAFLEPPEPLRRPSGNVQTIALRTHEAAYLAGWLAARMERRRPGADVVGIVGGFKYSAVDDFVIGFRAGARRGAPGLTVLTGYSGDFVDARKCETIARRQIARGAGAIFNVAGGCGLGALRAARREGVWGIGVDVDQSGLGPHILTSVLKSYEEGLHHADAGGAGRAYAAGSHTGVHPARRKLGARAHKPAGAGRGARRA